MPSDAYGSLLTGKIKKSWKIENELISNGTAHIHKMGYPIRNFKRKWNGMFYFTRISNFISFKLTVPRIFPFYKDPWTSQSMFYISNIWCTQHQFHISTLVGTCKSVLSNYSLLPLLIAGSHYREY